MADDPNNPGSQPTPQPTGQPQPDGMPKTFILDDNFHKFLPDDLKSDPSVQLLKGKNIHDVLRQHINVQRMIGGEKVTVPIGKNDTPEAWGTLWAKLGRPDDPDGYQLQRPEMPEGIPYNEESEKSFRALAHSIGLTPKQAAAIYEAYNKSVLDAHGKYTEFQRASREKSETALKAEWGNKFNEKVNLAKRTLETYGGKPDEVTAFIDKYGDDAVAIRVLASLGSLIGESNFVKGTSAEVISAPDQALKKAHDIMTNKSNPLNEAYYDKQHIRHNEAVEEVERYYTIAKGTEAVSTR